MPEPPVLVFPDAISFGFKGRQDLVERAHDRRAEALEQRCRSVKSLVQQAERDTALSEAFWKEMRSSQPALLEGVLRIARS